MEFTKPLFLVLLSFSSGMVMAQDGLVHQYKFDGNLQDAVGTAHGVIAGGAPGMTPIFIKGHDGTENGAIDFPLPPGPWYMVEVGNWSPSQEGVTGEMTVTFWAFWKGPNGTKPQDIINKRDSYKMDDMEWGINQHGHLNHVLSVHHPDKPTRATATKGIPAAVWTHVAIAIDKTKAYFYLDGALLESHNFTYAKDPLAMIHIGNSSNGGKANIDDVYNGALDDVRFYSRKLTDVEVASMAKSPTGILAPRGNGMKPRLLANSAGGSLRIKGWVGSGKVWVMDLNGRTRLEKDVASNGILTLGKVAPGLNIVKVEEHVED